MKKASRKASDELRPEYQRSDFGTLVRGKYAAAVTAASNIVVLEPQLARAFPNDRAVNDALRAVLRTRKRASRVRSRPATRRRATA
jgi:hypothetical protein